jgi:ATP/maltotriose-dependent transcriptional regulator MalT
MPQALEDAHTDRVTPRQRQIVGLLAAGYSNEEIGFELGISGRTVRAHCDALRSKLGVPHRRQIPFAYRSLTGTDPLALDRSVPPGL